MLNTELRGQPLPDVPKKMKWAELEIYIKEQIVELQRLMTLEEYVPFQPKIQQTMAVMIARQSPVHVLAQIEQDKAQGKEIDDFYAAAEAQYQLRLLSSD